MAQAARRHAEESAARPLSANRIKPRPAWEDPPLPFDQDQEGGSSLRVPQLGYRSRDTSSLGRTGSTSVVRKAKQQQLDRGMQQPDFDVVGEPRPITHAAVLRVLAVTRKGL